MLWTYDYLIHAQCDMQLVEVHYDCTSEVLDARSDL